MSTSAARRSGTRCAGFSIIEVVVVLVLLSVLAVLVSMGGRSTTAELMAEAQTLRAHLRFIQTMAMANNTCTWGIDLSGSGYSITRSEGEVINLPGENTPLYQFSSGIRITGGAGAYTFCQWGCPGQSVSITLSDGEQSETVTILALTGLVQ